MTESAAAITASTATAAGSAAVMAAATPAATARPPWIPSPSWLTVPSTATSRAASAGRPAANQPDPDRKKVAILIFDGVQIIDYTGTWEVFGQAGFDVFKNRVSTGTGVTA